MRLFQTVEIISPVLAVVAWCVAAAAIRFIPNQERKREDQL